MTFSIDNPEGGLQQPPLRKICLGKTLRRTRVKVKTGVKQGDVMSGFIFLIVIEWIMKNVTERTTQGSDGNSWRN